MFDEQYFAVTRPRQDGQQHDLLPLLGPDEATVELNYSDEVARPGHGPLVFINAARESRQRRGHTTVRTPPPVLFDGDHPLVRGPIREELLSLGIAELALQRAIFVDDWAKQHEYWYLTFLEARKYWHPARSSLGVGIPIGGDTLQTVYDFALDDDKLGRKPLKDRLLFQMDSLPSLVVAHHSVAGLFGDAGAKACDSGALVIPLREYPNRP